MLSLLIFIISLSLNAQEGPQQSRQEIIETFVNSPWAMNQINEHSLTMAMIDFYVEDYNKKHGTHHDPKIVAQKLKSLGSGHTGDKGLKATIEDNLKYQLGISSIYYNSQSTNPLDFLFSGQMQCYSGTMLYFLVKRLNSTNEELKMKNSMAIFRPNHVLPGKIEDGHLEGTEMTAEGSGKAHFGKVAKIAADTFLIDEKTYLLSELLDHYPDRKKVMYALALRSMINQTRFHLPRPKKSIDPVNRCRLDGTKISLCELNQSLFAFGDGQLPEGTFKRNVLEEMDCTQCMDKIQQNVLPLKENKVDLEAILTFSSQLQQYLRQERPELVSKLAETLVQTGPRSNYYLIFEGMHFNNGQYSNGQYTPHHPQDPLQNRLYVTTSGKVIVLSGGGLKYVFVRQVLPIPKPPVGSFTVIRDYFDNTKLLLHFEEDGTVERLEEVE